METFKFLPIQDLLLAAVLVSSSWKKAVYSDDILLHLLVGHNEREAASLTLYQRLKKVFATSPYLLHLSDGEMMIWNTTRWFWNSRCIENPFFINSCRCVLISRASAILTGGARQETFCVQVDVETEEISQLQPLLRRHVWHAIAVLDHVVYISGGDLNEVRNKYTEKYEQGSWTEIADMTTPRCNHTLCAYLHRIYAFGGSDNSEVLDSIEYYDCQVWQTAPMSLPSPRNYASVWRLKQGFLLIAGFSPQGPKRVVHFWKEATKEWFEICEAKTDYSLNNVVAVRDGKVYIYCHTLSKDSFPLYIKRMQRVLE